MTAQTPLYGHATRRDVVGTGCPAGAGRSAHSPVLAQGRAGLPIAPLHPRGRPGPALERAATAPAAVCEASWLPLRSRGVSPSVRPRRGSRCAERGGRRPGCGSGRGCQDAVTMGTTRRGPAPRRQPWEGGGESSGRRGKPLLSSLPRRYFIAGAAPWEGGKDPSNNSGVPCGAGDEQWGRGAGAVSAAPAPHMLASKKKVWCWQNSGYSQFLMVLKS